MQRMTKEERIKAAIVRKETDRIPFSVWYHLPAVDQDPIAAAEMQLQLARSYDVDFIKLMPFGNYVAQDYGLSVEFYCTETRPALERKYGIASIDDWANIEPLPAYYGTYGKQVQLSQKINKMMKKGEIPFVQTIFSPLTTAKKLAGPRVFEDLRSHPKLIRQALEAITQTTINFVKANIEAGVSGFFFATQCATSDFLTEQEFDEFGAKYDLKVIESYVDTTFLNILHIHGENTYFKKLAAYPCNCINWHDRLVYPDMGEARKLTDKCLMGGINEKWFENAAPEEIGVHVKEAVDSAGRKGLIITPGCCAELGTPKINYYAVRTAIEML